MPTLTEQLTEAATDLYYPSESDYPLEPFLWKNKKAETPKERDAEKHDSKEIEEIKEKPSLEKPRKKEKLQKPDTEKEDVSGKTESSVKVPQKENLVSASSSSTTVAPTAEDVLKNTDRTANTKIEEITIEKFFDRVTKTEDWYGDEENAIVQKFLDLKSAVETNLHDIKVFRVGETEIDVYLVGADSEGNFAGLKTTVVET